MDNTYTITVKVHFDETAQAWCARIDDGIYTAYGRTVKSAVGAVIKRMCAEAEKSGYDLAIKKLKEKAE